MYDKWRLPLDYKATFASMLRAMERHNQLHLDAETGLQVIYNPSLGLELAQMASSDEEENLEEAIAIRDSKIIKLQQERTALQHTLDNELASQNIKLERRMTELELHSDRWSRCHSCALCLACHRTAAIWPDKPHACPVAFLAQHKRDSKRRCEHCRTRLKTFTNILR